jgi:excisionase family DNA binding protein
LISSNDLAQRLGVSRATVLRAVARGLLQPAVVTPGGHRRFLLTEDAEELIERQPELVTSREAARLLGVSQPTLNRAVREGRLRAAAVTPGGHRRFAASELAGPQRAAAIDAGALAQPDSGWMEC